MREYTTLKLGGPADWLALPRNGEEIAGLIREAREAGMPVTVIGHGSNLLVLDGGIRGLTIRIGRNMREIRRNGNRLEAQAGAMLSALAAAAADAGLAGLEFAGGIPGTVGGGLAMNAGAYDGEMSQVTAGAEGLTPEGKAIRLNREELAFGYRTSAIQGSGIIITKAEFILEPGEGKAIREKMAELNGFL
jgi:UDP-N-acetylmuramate dehydrogenase